MRQIPRHVPLCCLAALSILLLSGCGPRSPEERVAAARAQYTVRLESFTVEEPAPEPEIAMAEEAGEIAAEDAGEAPEEVMEGAADAEVEEAPGESGPRTVDVVLHLLVRFGGDEALPGITVEVTQADPFGKEKEPTLHWIDTAGMIKSDVQQVDLKVEGVDFEDGDAFSVLLKESVPPEERSRYREFVEAGS